jgi:hypothetical protein
MTVQNLKKYTRRKSFRPFVLATTDGRRFCIDHELNIGISKRKNRVRVAIMLPDDGLIWVVPPEQIV